jgi:DNA topoisomerase-3
MAPPDAYSAEYKEWRLGQLPIVPRIWKLEVSVPGLIKKIRSLLKDADRVVHAGDPDREGQLLVDEVIEYLGYEGPVDRLLINDLSPVAVKRAVAALVPNQKYRPLYESALARQRADWLFGMNMTRLYTILGRNGGYDGVLSVGRVQTPLLGLIVKRDLAIENFQSVPYWQVAATMTTKEGATFRAMWEPGESVGAFLDEDRRLLNRDVAESVRDRSAGQTGIVVKRTDEEKIEAPPLPYSLADLQVDAGKKLGLSSAKVLDACQNLYEKHRLITYPRSDCSYLPEGHFGEATDVLAAVAKLAPVLALFVGRADVKLRSKAWNDKKVTAHHAIIPTKTADRAELSAVERSIYEAISRRYILQFYNVHSYSQARIEVVVGRERFHATGRRVIAAGWKAVLGETPVEEDEDAEKKGEVQNSSLPPVGEGDSVTASDVTILDKKTAPPKRFTDASLIQAMCNVARYVESPTVKKILSETDGIGTPATRGAIIETLFDRGFIRRDKRVIVSTATGRALAQILPTIATTPDMTATWEAAIRAIAEGQQTLDAFLSPVTAELERLVKEGKALGKLHMGKAHPCEQPKCTGNLRCIRGKNGVFWSCMVCRATVDDAGGQPVNPGERPAKSSRIRNSAARSNGGRGQGQ